jgi:1-acyl-sn-glycerol-3-phosphate acyltransferase
MARRAPHLAVPPAVPRRGNAFTRALGRLVLGVLGWRLEGTFPDLPKFVLVGYPHTSNWDAVVGMAAALAYGLEVFFFAKREAFRGPLGWLLRALGGIPVDRSHPGGLVAQAVEAFARRPAFVLGVTPEGTRSPVARWKTGFHHIAVSVGVPVVLVALDYGNRRIGPGPLLPLSGDLPADLARITDYFRGVRGKNPENASFPSPEQLGIGEGEWGRG